MDDFFGAMKAQQSQAKTLTENGAVAYATSGKALLDFNFAISAFRGANEEKIENMFSAAFYDNPLTAMKFLFWLRDPREGAGERRIFRVCLKWLQGNRPEVIKAVLSLVPDFGRWDDLWELLDTGAKTDVISLISETIEKDGLAMSQGKPTTLLKKWLCSENSSSKITKHFASIIRTGLEMTPKQYRQMLSAGRKYIDVVERKMSSGEWDEISYEAVPSRANLIYNSAFLKHDEQRRREYLSSLQKGETKINAGVLQPHEIVGKYVDYSRWYLNVNPLNITLEELWKALPDVTVGNTLVVEDTSGSMCGGYSTTTRPIDVATALGIYLSEHNDDEWKDKIISFSTHPQLLDMSNCKTLREKVSYIFSNAEVSDTDVEKTMLLILETAIANNYTQAQMPGTVLILSDCQFNEIAYVKGKKANASLFDNISSEYDIHGYKLPKIVFWNLSGQINKTIPIQQNEMGLVLMSGFSAQLMNMAMSSELDPYKALLETINAPRYDIVEEALKGIL